MRDRRQPFRRPEYARLALEELRYECDRHPALLVAYVVMPDHLHFIAALQDGLLSRFLARYKPGVTLKLDALANEAGRVRERNWLRDKGRRELWQDGKYSLPLYTPDWIRQEINYMHANPIRTGLVEDVGKYEWSSYAAYEPDLKCEPPVPVDLWGD